MIRKKILVGFIILFVIHSQSLSAATCSGIFLPPSSEDEMIAAGLETMRVGNQQISENFSLNRGKLQNGAKSNYAKGVFNRAKVFETPYSRSDDGALEPLIRILVDSESRNAGEFKDAVDNFFRIAYSSWILGLDIDPKSPLAAEILRAHKADNIREKVRILEAALKAANLQDSDAEYGAQALIRLGITGNWRVIGGPPASGPPWSAGKDNGVPTVLPAGANVQDLKERWMRQERERRGLSPHSDAEKRALLERLAREGHYIGPKPKR